MKRFIKSADRNQGTLFPEYLEDYVAENNPVRVVDVFVEHLDLSKLGFKGGWASHHWQTALPSLSSPQVIHLWLDRPTLLVQF
jgi:hypothetical protein